MSRSIDAAVAAVAVPQCGAFSIAQAAVAGADYRMRRRRVQSGAWLAGPGPILQLPGFPPTFVQRLWWAILAAPSGAFVSHWAAAALHHLTGFPPTRLTIGVPHGKRHVNPVAVVHQSCAPVVPVLVQGLPVTPIARTLVDLGSRVGAKRLGAAVDDADLSGACRLEAVRKEFLSLATQGRSGICTMRAVLDERADDAFVPNRADLEHRLDAVLKKLPVAFEAEAPLPGRESSLERVDRLCRAPRPLVIEGDGRRWHTRVQDFTRDARRRRDALAAGYPTISFTYGELRDDADGCLTELHAILGISRR